MKEYMTTLDDEGNEADKNPQLTKKKSGWMTPDWFERSPVSINSSPNHAAEFSFLIPFLSLFEFILHPMFWFNFFS